MSARRLLVIAEGERGIATRRGSDRVTASISHDGAEVGRIVATVSPDGVLRVRATLAAGNHPLTVRGLSMETETAT